MSQPEEQPRPLEAFWRTLTQFDRTKVNLWMGFRNALGIVLPLAVAVDLGYPASGLVAATGALNVAAADGEDSYRQRGVRMLASSVIGAAAVLIGALSAPSDIAVAGIGVLWAFAAGLMVCLGTAAGDIGMISLVVFIIYSRQSMTPAHAAGAGLIALAAGLLQTGLSIALWPFRGRQPERRAIGDFYNELARVATIPPDPYGAPPASQHSTRAQEALSSLAGDHRVEAELLFALVSQGERIRLSLFAVGRALVRARREDGSEPAAAVIQQFLERASHLLAALGHSIQGEPLSDAASALLKELENPAAALRLAEERSKQLAIHPRLSEARFQMDALAGQLRAAVELSGKTTPEGETAFAAREARAPWYLRLTGRVATLRANLSLESSACRHAIRLAICIAIGDILIHWFRLPRSYWLNMTVALVLKPDFGGTFSRGVLRLAGTYAGLALATVLFQVTYPTRASHVIGIGILAILMRGFGRANYGVLVALLSALIVLLFSLNDVAPHDVISSRALNTTIGGTLALVIYWIWPTRERTQAPQAMATMLDVYRLYFQAVARAYLDGRAVDPHTLDRLRIDSRLARSNVETSVDRLSAEPFADANQLRVVNAALASSHRFIHAAMALEAGLTPGAPPPAGEPFKTFSHNVETFLYLLAAHLRGSTVAPESLPNLREDHNRLARTDTALLIETDRMVNSLNTLAGQIFRWVGQAFPPANSRTP
jgi:uncharacterized membrane protein YccC